MAARKSGETRGAIVRLAHAGLGLQEFAGRAAHVISRAVPFDGVAIVATDPATGIPTGKWVDNGITGSAGMRVMEIELNERDVNTLPELVGSGRLAGSMSEATGGDLDRSPRHREVMRPHGFGDELRLACVRGSHMWGVIALHRELGSPDFAASEVDLLATLSGAFAEAFQRTGLHRDAPGSVAGPFDGQPGVLLLDDDDRVELANAAGTEWLDELRENERGLPLVVGAVARRARAVAAGNSDGMATARVRAASGRWALVRGSVISNETRARTAVTLEPARKPELAPLVVQAYGLTERERLVTERVAQGLSTAAIGRRLHLSSFTVQDHLKAIFGKVGVSNRGELVARLFLDHYYVGGRLRDPSAE